MDKKLSNRLDQVVQSIISLMRSLVEDLLSLTVLTKAILVMFFAEKNLRSFLKSSSHFKQQNGSNFVFNMFKISMSC